jgi:hypothetical protein
MKLDLEFELDPEAVFETSEEEDDVEVAVPECSDVDVFDSIAEPVCRILFRIVLVAIDE